ncbi:MAG: FtsX-like permease family protein [Bacteroidetes bacterium]|jgi:putative ABC transport system permease protein|nr:FtsX-like permease family protein [Bacteroidota bacterium]
MFRSYLRLAIRTLRRRLGYTAVNALGLTVGLGCCALVAVFLQYELSWDRHHEHADRIYRLISSQPGDEDFSTIIFGRGNASGDAQRAYAEQLVAEVPEIDQATNYVILDDPRFVTTEDGATFESERQLATNTGPAFADLFTFERVAGAPLAEALRAPGSAVLTASTAERYFGSADPIGQTLTVGSTDVTVRAVVADPPSNSRITFDLALQLREVPNWGAYHYVRLAAGADPEAVAPKVTAVLDAVNPRRLDREPGARYAERLQALTDIHFAKRALYDASPHRDPAYLWVFGAIGVLILVITTINYANLALALYADRNAEIGIRKALGGHREQIAGQFLAEAGLLAMGCVPLALGVCAAALPAFNGLMGTAIGGARLLQPSILGAMVALALGTGLAAGGYPAFVLARKKTVDLFDRALSSDGRKRWSLRHSFIALQFVVLIGLGSLSWIAVDQLRYMQGEALGYPTDTVVRTNFSGDSTAYQQFRQRLSASSAIQAVGMGSAEGVPRTPSSRAPFAISGADREYASGASREVDVHWFDVMGIEHPAIEAMQADGARAPTRYFVNPAAARLASDDDIAVDRVAPGATFNFTRSGAPPYPIAGVLPPIHLNSMRQSVDPALYEVTAAPRYGYNVLVRLVPGRIDDGLQAIRAAWPDVQPDTPLRTTFLDEDVAQLYEQEARFTTLSSVLASLAILLAALGLASLVAYLTRLRMKEIGIRKALGGSVASIVALLNTEYVQIVSAAFVVGAPLAWWAAEAWLGQFAYQVGLSPLVFVGAGLGALAVAVLAVSTQALRAARVDPATVLRSE